MKRQLRPAREQAMDLLNSTLDNFEALERVIDDLIAAYRDRPEHHCVIERLERAKAAARRGADVVRDKLH